MRNEIKVAATRAFVEIMILVLGIIAGRSLPQWEDMLGWKGNLMYWIMFSTAGIVIVRLFIRDSKSKVRI